MQSHADPTCSQQCLHLTAAGVSGGCAALEYLVIAQSAHLYWIAHDRTGISWGCAALEDFVTAHNVTRAGEWRGRLCGCWPCRDGRTAEDVWALGGEGRRTHVQPSVLHSSQSWLVIPEDLQIDSQEGCT